MNKAVKNDEFPTSREATNLVPLAEITFRRAIARGELTAYKSADGRVRLNRRELLDWYAKRSTPVAVNAKKSAK